MCTSLLAGKGRFRLGGEFNAQGLRLKARVCSTLSPSQNHNHNHYQPQHRYSPSLLLTTEPFSTRQGEQSALRIDLASAYNLPRRSRCSPSSLRNQQIIFTRPIELLQNPHLDAGSRYLGTSTISASWKQLSVSLFDSIKYCSVHDLPRCLQNTDT